MTTQFLAKLQLVVNCQFLKYRPLCGNDIIFLSLRLYVKSKLANLESQNLPIYNHIERHWIFTPFLWMFAPFWRLRFNKLTKFWSQKWLKWQILSDRKLWDVHTECKYLYEPKFGANFTFFAPLEIPSSCDNLCDGKKFRKIYHHHPPWFCLTENVDQGLNVDWFEAIKTEYL